METKNFGRWTHLPNMETRTSAGALGDELLTQRSSFFCRIWKPGTSAGGETHVCRMWKPRTSAGALGDQLPTQRLTLFPDAWQDLALRGGWGLNYPPNPTRVPLGCLPKPFFSTRCPALRGTENRHFCTVLASLRRSRAKLGHARVQQAF